MASILDNTREILLDKSFDRDINFFDTDIHNWYTPYVLSEEFEKFSSKLNSKCFSILYLNTQSLNKNFNSFKLFSSSLNFEFSIMFFWNMDDSALACESLYELRHYNSLP